MDAAANAIVEVVKCLWDSLAKPISYIYNPTENLKLLEREVRRLMNKSADIERRVEAAEASQLNERTNEVVGWLKEVQDLKAKCDQVLEEGNSHHHNKCLVWCCPGNCRSNYNLRRNISQLCNDVKECRAAGEFPILVNPLPPPRVREMPSEKTVGLDPMLSLVWEWLQEKHVGIIGLYGMGGVGKTTLLKKINEKFHCKSHEFHVVLWIVVSKQVNLDKIRESIRKDLGIRDDVWSDRSEEARAAELCRVLNKKRFVLLIDDIWERLDVARVGIPFPNSENGSKMVFTTQLERVCGQMKASKKVKVQCLSPQEALELFRENVGEDTLNLHPDMSKFSIEIADECKGLPLALITIGRAMASMKTPDEWASALRVLRNYPPEFSEMVDDVYNLLRFSYDRLDSTHKHCFLYCALFPEDYNINKDHLIDLWIGEGFLGDTDNIYRTRDRGEFVIRSLKSACLLERGRNVDKEVKMHDVIRDMALWLAREQGQRNNKILVEEDDKQIVANISRWEKAERISLQSLLALDGMNNLTELPVCPSLVTLLIDDTDLETLSVGFFMSLQALRVLEIHSKRKPHRISKLPTGISGLVNLQYLNLSNTNIVVLPNEIKSLTSLLYLLLDMTNNLRNIPKEVISSLLSLKVFRKTHNLCIYEDEKGFIEGVGCLKQLDELSLTVHKAFSVQRLLNSPNLQRSIRDLEIRSCLDLSSIDANISRRLELTNLRHVYILNCNPMNLSWLIYAPNLQTLFVRDCYTLEVIFDEDTMQSVDENASARLFSSLRSLSLSCVPKLRSIHKGTLSSPALTTIMIRDCPGLKKLPFNFNSVKNNLKEVKANLEWWSALEWDDEAAKVFFTAKLVSI